MKFFVFAMQLLCIFLIAPLTYAHPYDWVMRTDIAYTFPCSSCPPPTPFMSRCRAEGGKYYMETGADHFSVRYCIFSKKKVYKKDCIPQTFEEGQNWTHKIWCKRISQGN